MVVSICVGARLRLFGCICLLVILRVCATVSDYVVYACFCVVDV